MLKPHLPTDAPVSTTVYSVVWPETEALIRRLYATEGEAMLEMHRNAHTKKQDGMHQPFFDAWRSFAASCVRLPPALGECYPTAGSSEAIREIIRTALWKGQDLVIFDGEYEGYEAIAHAQGTRVHRVPRELWKETLDQWQRDGVPWGLGGAQWWISQPSAIEGNAWDEFQSWLRQVNALENNLAVWVDLTYVGRARLFASIELDMPCVAGVVFSLSKVMGAYYRRIGGCISREPVEGLWANRWFKNLDSLYMGTRWLQEHPSAYEEGGKYRDLQARAMEHALQRLPSKAAWDEAGIRWVASDVPLLMHATPAHREVGAELANVWHACGRGLEAPVSRRLCLTPSIAALLGVSHVD